MTTAMDRREHWDGVFHRNDDADVSWYQEVPEASLALVDACALPPDAALIDVGAGSSRMVDHLLDRGYGDVTALDISQAALERSRTRLGPRAAGVHWIVADVTRFEPARRYRLWHDRAVFHFLTDEAERLRYRSVAEATVAPGGWLILAAFAPHGPTRCSGLEVQRHDGASMAAALGASFTLVDERVVDHHTPSGAVQPFTFARFHRSAP